MATTALAVQTLPGNYSTTGLVATMPAADNSNGNHFPFSGDQMIVVCWNSGASPYTVTITSQAAPISGRLGDVSAVSLAADEIRIFRLSRAGWVNSAGNVLISASNAAVKIGVFKF